MNTLSLTQKSIFHKLMLSLTLILGTSHFISCSSQSTLSSIYFGGDILTMSESGQDTIEAVFVKGGKIVALGSKADILRKKEADTELIDLQGKTLMPGFIAVHTHPDISAYLHDMVDLSGFSNNSPEEVWGTLRQAVEQRSEGEWIFCKGFDPMLVDGLQAPDINMLDEIAPDNPVAIIAQSLHSAWGNSLAFQLAGITAETPDPGPNSYYEKDDKGNLTGFVSEVAAILPFRDIALTTFNLAENVVKVYDDYAKNGFTSITTMGIQAVDKKPFMLYEYLSTQNPKLLPRALARFGILPEKKPTVRHFVYLKYDTPFLFPETVENGDDFFKVLGLKLWYDGSPYTGSMYLKDPYLNSDLMIKGLNIPHDHYGAPVMSVENFTEAVNEYHKKGWQISIHSQGDQSTEEVLTIMKDVINNSDRQDHRHRIEHGVLLPPELIGQIKGLGMTASFHVNHLYYYGQDLRDNIIGDKRVEKMLPVGSTNAANIPFSLHADAPMYEEDPFHLLQTAVLRQTREGDIIGEHEKISILDGLKSFTIYSAWQLHMDDKIGSIEAGKYADFVILDKNPLKVTPDSLRDIKVLNTIVNGEDILK